MYTQDIPLDPEIADKYIQLELRKRQIEYTIRNEVFQAQETLCNINSTDNDLIKATYILNKRDYDNVIEERVAKNFCGFPRCKNELLKYNKKQTYCFRTRQMVSPIYSNFCSTTCEEKSDLYKNSLFDIPTRKKYLLEKLEYETKSLQHFLSQKNNEKSKEASTNKSKLSNKKKNLRVSFADEITENDKNIFKHTQGTIKTDSVDDTIHKSSISIEESKSTEDYITRSTTNFSETTRDITNPSETTREITKPSETTHDITKPSETLHSTTESPETTHDITETPEITNDIVKSPEPTQDSIQVKSNDIIQNNPENSNDPKLYVQNINKDINKKDSKSVLIKSKENGDKCVKKVSNNKKSIQSSYSPVLSQDIVIKSRDKRNTTKNETNIDTKAQSRILSLKEDTQLKQYHDKLDSILDSDTDSNPDINYLDKIDTEEVLEFKKLPKFSQQMAILQNMITDITYHILDIQMYTDSSVTMEDVYQDIQQITTDTAAAEAKRLEIFIYTVLQYLSRIINDLHLDDIKLLPRISLFISTFRIRQPLPYIDTNSMHFLVLCLVKTLSVFDEQRLKKFDPQFYTRNDYKKLYRSYLWFPNDIISEYCENLSFTRDHLDSVSISFRL